MRQLRPETGETLVTIFKTLIQLYLFCLFLYYLTYYTKEGIKGNIFGNSTKNCWPKMQLRPETGESPAIFKSTNKIVFVLSPVLLFYLIYQKDYQR